MGLYFAAETRPQKARARALTSGLVTTTPFFAA